LNGSNSEAVGNVVAGVPTTLTLSGVRSFSVASAATLTCATPLGATAKYANLIATQVKSASRAAG
jgi:hypothetical protein